MKKLREILFKGKIKDEEKSELFGSWWYGDLIHYANGDICIRQMETGMELQVIPESICQLVERIEENKFKKAMTYFENDIVEVDHSDKGIKCVIRTEENEGYRFAAYPIDKVNAPFQSTWGFFQMNTIGNIIDNPELLVF
jgi:hypothetical protein